MTPQWVSVLRRSLCAVVAAWLVYHARHALTGYLHGTPSPEVDVRGYMAPLYASPDQALVVAVAFGLGAMVLAYFALRPSPTTRGWDPRV